MRMIGFARFRATASRTRADTLRKGANMRPRKCPMQMTIYLSEPVAAAVATIAHAHGATESQVVRQILTVWLQQTGNLAPRHAPQVSNGNGALQANR